MDGVLSSILLEIAITLTPKTSHQQKKDTNLLLCTEREALQHYVVIFSISKHCDTKFQKMITKGGKKLLCCFN